MRFKNWLAEWEGNTFMQAPEFTNGPIFQSRGVGSKYTANKSKPFEEEEDEEDEEEEDEEIDDDDKDIDSDPETETEKIKSLFGFTKDDELDELRKKVRRKKD